MSELRERECALRAQAHVTAANICAVALHARPGSHLFSIMRAGVRCGAKRREQRLQLGHIVARVAHLSMQLTQCNAILSRCCNLALQRPARNAYPSSLPRSNCLLHGSSARA